MSLNLSFAKRDGQIKLCAQIKGTTERKYERVVGLKANYNLDSWDSKKFFCEASEDAIYNNAVLKQTMLEYQALLKHRDFTSGKEFFDYVKNIKNSKVETKKVSTFGEFLASHINEMRNGQNGKSPSANYQNYIKLQNKLKKEAKIINMPIDKIDDCIFEDFGNWVKANYKKTVYVPTMKLFHSTHEKARKKRLTTIRLNFDFKECAPTTQAKKIDALTTKEYNKFVNLDLTQLGTKGRSDILATRTLYRDFLIFSYETYMRPIDAISIRLSDIDTENKILHYYVKKNKNKKKQREILVPLSTKAQEIIKKYKGKSSQGYIFPFAMNEYIWDLEDNKNYENGIIEKMLFWDK